MSIDGLLSIVLAVLIPFLLAVAGGILAVRALPSETSRIERYWWVAGFVFLLVIGILLSFYQQVRISNNEQIVSKAEKDKEIKAEGEIKYTQGQLDSINKILATIVNSNTLDSRGVTLALLRGALQAGRSGEGVQPPAIQRMTNQQLRAKVLTFVNTLRKECSDYMSQTESIVSSSRFSSMSKEEREKAWQESINRSTSVMNNFNLRLQQQYSGDSTIYRDELLRRLGPQSPQIPPLSAITWWKMDGSIFVGYYQALGTADYLERLAKQLPQ
jgi:arginine exporter protein ArgO